MNNLVVEVCVRDIVEVSLGVLVVVFSRVCRVEVVGVDMS